MYKEKLKIESHTTEIVVLKTLHPFILSVLFRKGDLSIFEQVGVLSLTDYQGYYRETGVQCPWTFFSTNSVFCPHLLNCWVERGFVTVSEDYCSTTLKEETLSYY